MTSTQLSLLLRCMVIAAATFAQTPISLAQVDKQVTEFAILRGSLSDALLAWASQSGVQIIFGPEIVAKKKTSGLTGTYTAAEGLNILLRNTGVSAEPLGDNAWIVRRDQQAKPAAPVAMKVQTALETDQPIRELSAISVYSRPLLRIATESSMPVITISRSDIESSGYLTLFDLLRNQPGVQVTSQPELMGGDSAGTFTPGATGAASVALRSLGAKATLILVDGRRVTSYGLAADSTGSVADIGTIPLAMVERIDILHDGAATLYGADAMAGVIDISLRKDFEGTEVTALIGQSSRGDATHRQVSAAFGKRLESGASSVVMLDAVSADPLLGNRRDWYSLDRRRDGLRDARSEFSFPGNRVIERVSGSRTLVAREGCLPADLDSSGRCLDDRAKATSLKAGRDSASVRSYFHLPVNDTLEFYADARLTTTQQTQQSGPTRTTILIPTADNPGNSELVDYAFWDVGPVKQTTTSTLSRIDVGFAGWLGLWSWDLGADAEINNVDDDISGLVNRAGFARVVVEHGYRFDQRPAPREIAELLAPTVSNEGQSRASGLRATASRDFSIWNDETLHLNLGIESRNDSIRLRPDATLVSGQLLIETPVLPFAADRSSSAIYGHIDLPIASGFSADVGVRLEHVQGNGHFVAPALGLRWTPTDAVMFRAGAAKGRRVPTLLEQRGLDVSGTSPSYMSFDVPTPLLPCQTTDPSEPNRCLLEVRPVSGPALKAEHSYSAHAGVVWEPSQSFNASFDVYSLQRNDEIGLIPINYALQNSGLFPNLLERDQTGRLQAINFYRVNLGRTTTRGIDANMNWNLDFMNYGSLTLHAGVNRITELSIRATPNSADLDRAGYAGQPKWTASASARWAISNWAVTLGISHVGSYRYSEFSGDSLSCPAYVRAVRKCSTPALNLANVNVSTTRWDPWRLMFNVSNMFDHTPRYYRESAGGYNPLYDDPIGRYFSMGLSRSF